MTADPQAGPVAPVPAPLGPLVVSADAVLVDEVGRLAAAVGAAPPVVTTPREARPAWSRAPLVLVGSDAAADLAVLSLPRRAGVHLLASAPVAPEAWPRALALGAEAVRSLPRDRDVLAALLGACTDGAADGVLVAVTGGCGGAGASVFAAALAATGAAAGRSTLLVDADPWGGGADLLVGAEEVTGLRWSDLAATTGRVAAASLRGVLPVVDDVAVLSWGRDEPVPVAAGAARTVLTAARRGHHLVVADLAHRGDAVAEALAMATLTVLVVPAGAGGRGGSRPAVGTAPRDRRPARGRPRSRPRRARRRGGGRVPRPPAAGRAAPRAGTGGVDRPGLRAAAPGAGSAGARVRRDDGRAGPRRGPDGVSRR